MQELPTLSCEQIRRVDRVAIEQWGIPGVVLMENAGRGVADVLCEVGIQGPVLILCARGNNGGDGLVIARHLHLRGYATTVVLACDPDAMTGDAAWNLKLLMCTNVTLLQSQSLSEQQAQDLVDTSDWVVDALLGTGARGAPREPLATWIQRVNQSGCKTLAVDIPSGLDATTGSPSAVTFRADHTCTFVAAKEGFTNPKAQACLGQLHVLDIGLPWELVTAAVYSS